MLFSLHADALKEILATPQKEHSVFARSKICLTEKILDEYEKVASDPILANYFYPFMAQMQGRLKLIDLKLESTKKLSEIDQHYLASSKYGGRKLVISSSQNIDENIEQVYENSGISFIETSLIYSDDGKLGFEPFERHQLHHMQSCPPACLDPFFKNEARLLFFDKHINEDSISLINRFISLTSENSQTIIVTSEKSKLDKKAIRLKIKLKDGQKVRVEFADKKTCDRVHDRFIYIDNHYEIHIPRGLDTFGREPKWINSNCTIALYDVFNSGNKLTLSFIPDQGNAPRPISVNSIVNT